MVDHVWFETMIDAFQQGYIAAIVAPHQVPGFFLAAHTPRPQIEPCMHQLLAEFEILAQIAKLVALKMKNTSSNFEGINRFVGLWWEQAIDDEARISLANIKPIAVVCNQYVGFIEQLVQVL